MKLLIYSANFAPEPTGIGKYSGEMAAWLAAQGHEVRVICAPPYYPAWQLDPAYSWPPYRRENWQGVDVWRAPLWVPRQPGGIVRVMHLLTFAVSSLPLALWQVVWRPDVVMTVAPAFVCAPAGWLTARLSGAKAWLHIQDFEVDVAFQMGLLKGSLAQRVIRSAERWLLRRFDRVSSISRRMVMRLKEKGVDPARTYNLPNWVDLTALRPLQQPSTYRAELGIAPGTIVTLFSGTLGNKQGLMLIPEAARELAHRPDIVFVICGDGVMREPLETACSGLTNVRMLPLQPAERLNELLGLADIHLLTQSPGAEDLVLPSKLSGMLASGRPIVATCREDTEIAEVLRDCGIVVPPEATAAFSESIERLGDDADRRQVLGAAGRSFAEANIERETVLRNFVDTLNSLFDSQHEPQPRQK